MADGEKRPIVCSSCVVCPICNHEFQHFANAESFSHIRCPKCKRWFHVHFKLGANPVSYLNPDEFQQEIEETPGIFDEDSNSELLDED